VTTPARRLAFDILSDVETGPTLAERLAAPEIEALEPRERAFLHELALGVLRRRGGLDYSLAPLVDRPLAKLSPEVLTALRLGAYQVLHLRVPEHAAVSESVELARRSRPRAAGFVNAVLRRLVREGPAAEPDPTAEPKRWLTTAGSLPSWLADRWLEQLGPEGAIARARGALEVPPIDFRINPRSGLTVGGLAELGIEAQGTEVPDALQLSAGRVTEAARLGRLYPQDRSSQLVARLAARPGLVLDACAAPGGKSLLLGDVLGGSATVFAAEAVPRRLRTLASLVARWGSTNVLPLGADARHPPFRTRFDSVLLDAPCSGLGTIGRHPDIRWRLQPRDLARHTRRQAEILEALAPLVKEGGRIVYATCSLEPEENEGVVAPFLEAHREFAPEQLPDGTARYAAGPFLRTRPEEHGGDGFFAAVLRRSAPERAEKTVVVG
jgi:16S rRNA (cytosine967-C5)-methyltransferase